MSGQDQTKYANKLQDANVLILGGTSGIGLCVAEASLEFGALVSVASSNPERVHQAVAKLQKAYPSKKDNIRGYQCDLGNQDTMEKNTVSILEKVVQDTGKKLDHIVHLSGTGVDPVPLSALGVKDMTDRNSVNLRFFSPLMFGKHAPKYMNPGPSSSITLTSGVLAIRPLHGTGFAGPMTGNAASSLGMTKGLAVDLAPLRVNLVLPGAVDTPLWDALPGGIGAVLKAKAKDTMLTKIIGKPEDVAESYLCCMRDANMTGTEVHTNGGTLLF
ncbi:NAD(P)-binding protein [Rhizodiscina lignyota]|uniref:NAD(P)-binding protein n=1 Tax=Rhizodiscina lignyota TaxID=1504668 RepID=A0A9P4MAP9_9PEZI|nr:NAD(P)-binding protein [Rhizodiscina lignyota]